LTISRLRAGLAITFAAVSLMAGAQAAEACTEPTLGDLPARGEEKQLVRFELTGLTPGSEYLVKVGRRERKSGVATTDTVSRRFRMPHLGDSNRRVKVEVVIAHDACETSPWKLEEKMTYRPAPAPEPPVTQVEPAPTPAPSPDPSPPPPAPSPPAAPSITDAAPAPKSVDPPAIPKSSVTPPTPTVTPPAAAEDVRKGRAWVTPADPYQKGENTPPKLGEAALARTDRPSDVANSTAALIGLGGIFLLLAGTGAIGWTRFRRYDDQRLEEILNPEGKLPTHLDPKAKDMATEGAPERDRILVAGSARDRKAAQESGGRRGVLAHLSDEERASMSEEELEALKAKLGKERNAARRHLRRRVLPTFDPTDPAAAAGKEEQGGEDSKGNATPQKARRWLRRKAPVPAADPMAVDAANAAPAKPDGSPSPGEATEKPTAEQPGHTVPTGEPPPQAVPPIPAPHVNGGGRAGNGTSPPHHTYREQVETELQRILDDAGLHTEVDGILADARAEAQRQGVPIDSELMLRALCEDTNGAAKLSDSTKGELESRFKRIVAEERGELGPTPGSQPPHG
jgi:hypothetical protein